MKSRSKLSDKYCNCEYGPRLGDGRIDSSWCPVDDGTKEEVLEWGARGWDKVTALEARVEELEAKMDKPVCIKDVKLGINALTDGGTGPGGNTGLGGKLLPPNQKRRRKMTELLPLDHYKECPKCGSDEGFDKEYVERPAYMRGNTVITSGMEYIRMTCRDCRFVWMAKPKEKIND